ncbi:hypothetical protein GX563_08170 [Candidatus Bathyarchaeota archaeon]|nr:hypothetical protein [Candidatus Bathyarchaeota archaeon]
MKKPSNRTLIVIAIIAGVAAFCTLVLPYMLCPQWYIPKANASTGYTAPVTAEGWALMIAGFVFVGIATVCLKLRKLD